jgi:hypothetical protein
MIGGAGPAGGQQAAAAGHTNDAATNDAAAFFFGEAGVLRMRNYFLCHRGIQHIHQGTEDFFWLLGIIT